MMSNKWKTKEYFRLDWRYLIFPLAFLIVLWTSATFTGHWITEENPYRSYTLQACAWLDGRLDLGTDYPWLELAIYEGKFSSIPIASTTSVCCDIWNKYA